MTWLIFPSRFRFPASFLFKRCSAVSSCGGKKLTPSPSASLRPECAGWVPHKAPAPAGRNRVPWWKRWYGTPWEYGRLQAAPRNPAVPPGGNSSLYQWKDKRGNPCAAEAFQGGLKCSVRGVVADVELRPHIRNADIGVGVKTFRELGPLMKHVALRAAGGGHPREQAVVASHLFSGALFQPLLVNK